MDSEDEHSTGQYESDSEDVDTKRMRLAKKYIEEIQGDVESKGKRLKLDVDVKNKRRELEVSELEIEDPVFHKGHKLSPTSICVTKDESSIFTGGKDCAVIQWNAETGKKTILHGRRKQFSTGGHFEQVLGVSYCDSLQLLVSVGLDEVVRVWDPRAPSGCIDTLRGHTKGITSVKCEADSPQFFTASLDKTVKLWDLEHRCCVETYFGHQEPIHTLDLYQKGKPFTGSLDKTGRFWKTQVDTHVVFSNHTASIDACKVVTHQTFATGGEDGQINLWSTTSKKPIGQVEGHGGNWITALGCVRGGNILVSGSCDYLKVWKLEKEKKKVKIELKKEVKIKGVVNDIAESKSFFACAVGTEHKLGRWIKVEGKCGIAILKHNAQKLQG